jgi:hypothetical protein
LRWTRGKSKVCRCATRAMCRSDACFMLLLVKSVCQEYASIRPRGWDARMIRRRISRHNLVVFGSIFGCTDNSCEPGGGAGQANRGSLMPKAKSAERILCWPARHQLLVFASHLAVWKARVSRLGILIRPQFCSLGARSVEPQMLLNLASILAQWQE